MKIIDAHLHFSDFPGFRQVAKRAGHENSTQHLAEVFAKNNIVMGVAMGSGMHGGHGPSLPMTVNLNGELNLEHYNQPSFITYCCGVESKALRKETMNETLDAFEKHLQTKHCVGIKLYPGYNHFYVYDPIHEPFYDLAKAYDVPVVIHTGDTANPDALVKYAHPLTVDEVAVAHRGVRFVIAHCGNPWIPDAVEMAAKNPNVFIDLSGLAEGNFTPDEYFKRYGGYAENLKTWVAYLSDYGKLLYGSDWPLVNIPSYIQVMGRIIPERHHEEFFYGNAKRVFRRLDDLGV